MARKIKFALEMADGTFISNLEDLQKHIKNNDDVKKLVEYFLDGRLEKWLLDRYYEEEAKALQTVDKDDPDFTCKLCKAIGADYTPMESVNIELIEYEKKMRKALEEVTDDTKIIENAGSTASTQSDLDFLIKNGKKTIYLWGNSFKLPVVKNISYIGILGKPSVDIGLPDLEAVESYGIKFKNLNLPESILRAEEEKKRKAEEEAKRRAEEEARRRAYEEARRRAEEEARRIAEEEARRRGEEERIRQLKNANIGDIVKFGNYPQTVNGGVQPIEWQVLTKENNKMLVISKYALDVKRFDGSSNDWGNSEIRKWLNGEFYNKAFTDQEKKFIKYSNLSDVDTADNLFLLSYDEANKYFVNNDARKCKATDYVWKRNGWGDDYKWWWLRSPNPDFSHDVCGVNFGGCIFNCFGVYIDFCLARPALWINLDANENNDTKLENVKLPERFNPNPFKSAKVGDYVKFGNYPHTANGDVQPIEWLVLSKENNKMLVISKYGLEARRFDSDSNNWANSEIRKWLNGEFYNRAFNDKEKKLISSSNISTTVYYKVKKETDFWSSLLGQQEEKLVETSELTDDYIFLLTKEEAEKYFVNNEGRRCKATAYAKNNGGYVDDNGYSVWWLRSSYPDDSSYVFTVGSDGRINCPSVRCDSILIRPALWINL